MARAGAFVPLTAHGTNGPPAADGCLLGAAVTPGDWIRPLRGSLPMGGNAHAHPRHPSLPRQRPLLCSRSRPRRGRLRLGRGAGLEPALHLCGSPTRPGPQPGPGSGRLRRVVRSRLRVEPAGPLGGREGRARRGCGHLCDVRPALRPDPVARAAGLARLEARLDPASGARESSALTAPPPRRAPGRSPSRRAASDQAGSVEATSLSYSQKARTDTIFPASFTR
jgi:hypothetical protein